MKSILYLFVLVLSFVPTRDLGAQNILPYPSMKEVIPSVSAVAQPVNSEYQYSYLVASDSNSSQQVHEFITQIRSTNASGGAPSDWWASRATRPGIVAVTWTSLDSTRDITPGSSLSGFQILSPGLPSIVQFYAVGRIPIPYGEFRVETGTDDIFINSAQGRTLGPADPPSPFVPLTFLDTLIAMKNEALDLRWIEQSDLSLLIDEKLDKARSNLVEENESEAEAELQACLEAVLAECIQLPPDSDLTPEACALLQFNIEYLLEQIE